MPRFHPAFVALSSANDTQATARAGFQVNQDQLCSIHFIHLTWKPSQRPELESNEESKQNIIRPRTRGAPGVKSLGWERFPGPTWRWWKRFQAWRANGERISGRAHRGVRSLLPNGLRCRRSPGPDGRGLIPGPASGKARFLEPMTNKTDSW